MVDRDLVTGRLALLKEYLELLRSLALRRVDAFREDAILSGALQHYLRVAAEVVIETATHVLAEEGLAVPQTYRAVFEELARANVMTRGLARKLQGWAGLRSVLVHRYVTVDLARLHDVIDKELEDLVQFAAWASDRALVDRHDR